MRHNQLFVEICQFQRTTHVSGTSNRGDPVRISPRSLASANKGPQAIMQRCLPHPTFTIAILVELRLATDIRTDTRLWHMQHDHSLHGNNTIM